MNTRGSETYRYSPLNSNQMRLLHLHAGVRTSRLECSLTSHSFNDHPAFKALSYTWGDLGDIHDVSCNGRSVQVTRNLIEALHHLRREDTDELLWIDAICINQGDSTERSVQVRRMHQIYSQAESVLVWLGKAIEHSPLAFDLMRQLHTMAVNTEPHDLDRPMPKDSSLLRSLPKAGSLAWRALEVLLWRPWFTRAWVIQEITMARSATVICGEDIIPWQYLVVVISFLNRRFITIIIALDLGPAHPLKELYLFYRSTTEKPLIKLLASTRRSMSGNPCDKVYALLGLATDSSLTPDYRLPVTEVFKEVSRNFLVQSLDVLSLVGGPTWKAIEGLPSWTADWSQPLPESSYLYEFIGSPLNACGSTTSSIRFSEDRNILFVKGIVFDRVDLHGSSNINPNVTTDEGNVGVSARGLGTTWSYFFNVSNVRRFRYWERLVLRLKQYPTGEPIEDVLHRTMIADNLSIPREAVPSVPLKHLYESFRRTARLPGERVKSENGTEEVDEASGKIYSVAIERATRGRRLFSTKRGYVGLGPSGTRAKDCVVFLAGGRTAYILRKRKEASSYTFLGEAYLHGLMRGEAFQGAYTMQYLKII